MRAGPGAQYGSLFVKNRAPDARSRGSLAGAMDERAACPPEDGSSPPGVSGGLRLASKRTFWKQSTGCVTMSRSCSTPPISCLASQGQDRLQGRHLMRPSPRSPWQSVESRSLWENSHMPQQAPGSRDRG